MICPEIFDLIRNGKSVRKYGKQENKESSLKYPDDANRAPPNKEFSPIESKIKIFMLSC